MIVNETLEKFLKEDSPVTKSFKQKNPKIKKMKTTIETEEEDILLQNKILKFKLDCSAKELQELKYQMRVSKEMTSLLKKKSLYLKEDDKDINIENPIKNLIESNYYVFFIEGLLESIDPENSNNMKSLIQNQGTLLRSKHLEINFQNSLMQQYEEEKEKGLLLKYNLFIQNLGGGVIENLWILYKEPSNTLVYLHLFLKRVDRGSLP